MSGFRPPVLGESYSLPTSPYEISHRYAYPQMSPHLDACMEYFPSSPMYSGGLRGAMDPRVEFSGNYTHGYSFNYPHGHRGGYDAEIAMGASQMNLEEAVRRLVYSSWVFNIWNARFTNFIFG
jgi:hypothetical protein